MRRSPIARVSAKKRRGDAEYAKARRVVYARDVGCVALRRDVPGLCVGGLHVHHVLPRSRGGSHDVENLVLLCSWHHEWAHGHPELAKGYGLLA